MVVTVTFNPALDYVLRLSELRAGELNRTLSEDFVPGGKGINVSVVLSRLGIPTRALGFAGGFTGAEIERRLAEIGVETDFAPVSGESRINVKIRAQSETEINARGALPSAAELEILFEKLDGLAAGDVLVLAGGVPAGLPADTYERILARIAKKKIRFAADATGELLLRTLAFAPFLVKPNEQELGELFGKTLRSEEEICFYARELARSGARNVLVSRAEKGAVLATQSGKLYALPAPEGRVLGAVGAGDSSVAGFLAATLRGESETQAFRLAVAAGSATAFSEWLADAETIRRTLARVEEPREIKLSAR